MPQATSEFVSALPAEGRTFLEELVRAYDAARDAGMEPWQFSIQWQLGGSCRVADSNLRWLLAKELIEHGEELTRPEDNVRQFKPLRSMTLPDRTCVILTAMGADLLRPLILHQTAANFVTSSTRPELPNPRSDVKRYGGESIAVPRPFWDGDSRDLHFDRVLIKSLRLHAKTQATILAAFEEEGWPSAIDDPLVPLRQGDHRTRLRATIGHLNQGHLVQMIRFASDSAHRICWRRI